MNTRLTLIALLAAAVTVPAMADTATGSVTRQEVRAEYLRASKAGELDFAREFISAPAPSRKAGNESAASTNVEDLPPTAAGNHEVAVRNPAAGKTVQ